MDGEASDLVFLNFGRAGPCGMEGDVTGEGFVDQDDLDIWLITIDSGCNQTM